MFNPCWQFGRHAGTALALVAAAANMLPASDWMGIGVATPVGMPIANQSVASASPELAEKAPIYRLPVIEERGSEERGIEDHVSAGNSAEVNDVEENASNEPPITPIDEPQSEFLSRPSERQITILPPITQSTNDKLFAADRPEEIVAAPLPALAAPLPSQDITEQDITENDTETETHTITILPPVDYSGPTITELPPPTDSHEPTPTADLEFPAEPAPATENAATRESENTDAPDNAENLNQDFDAAWNHQAEPPTAEHANEPMLETLPEQTAPLDSVPLQTGPLQTAPQQEAQRHDLPQQFEPLPVIEPAASASTPLWTPYAPTTAELSRQLLPNVRRAYDLAQHGAVYAAQTEFIQVLRRIAESKDAATGTDHHSRALAAGLRALDEADDFAPKGAALEADVNVTILASAHRTPVLKSNSAITDLKSNNSNNAKISTTLRPAQAIALYHQYAREQLAQAVAGEQAGSMALYGLGKVNNRLARESDGELQFERKALTMFAAALDAGPSNHLAANELGVLLARAGQPALASEMFRRAIDIAPTSTGYHNLAVTDRALGLHAQAVANEQYAWQIAQRDRATGAASRAKGVEWVKPQDMSRVAQTSPQQPMPVQPQMVSNPPTGPQRLPQSAGPLETAAKWPQKLVPGVFRR
jgi:tetratricopeptide (TPR) repeat protein